MTTQALAGPTPTTAPIPRPPRHRDTAERLLSYADLLDRADRALLLAIFDRGLSAAEFARAMDQPPRTVRQRVQRLVERIGSARFQFVIRNRYGWPTARRQVGQAVFLRGLTQRRAAAQLGLSLHQVRQEIERIRTLYRYQL